ncbi:MAG: hypothetical protein RL654_1001 [Pseudomonadota bacterium]|jgi:hypothetical protein
MYQTELAWNGLPVTQGPASPRTRAPRDMKREMLLR